jgi:uncharacterized repeat protein (TIGR03847 family)
MPTLVHAFDWPDRVVVGTVGQPGERSFYLQARAGARIVSVALEKQQSALLAEKIEEILDELMTSEGNRFSIPAITPLELVDNDPLEQPVEVEFRTGAISLGFDPRTAQVMRTTSKAIRRMRSRRRCCRCESRSVPPAPSRNGPSKWSGRVARSVPCVGTPSTRPGMSAHCPANSDDDGGRSFRR